MLGSTSYTKTKSNVLTPQVFDGFAKATTCKNNQTFTKLKQNSCDYSSSGSSSTCSTNGNVKFSGLFKEKIDDREKFLTAKYPNHQMALIKKRLKVEFWIDEKLKNLFQIKEDNTKEDYEICPDDLVDTLLDIDSDDERTVEVIKQLSKVTTVKGREPSKESIMIFVDELLIKLRML